MPLYGRRTLGRPQIDTSSAEAVSGLIGLAMQLVAQGASEKLRLKEKKEAQSLTLLAEKYHSVTRDLTRVEGEYDKSKSIYEATLGAVQPIDRTTGSDSITDNLEQYYVNAIDARVSEKGKLKNEMNRHYSDLADISRVQAGLLKSVTPEEGLPGVYDPADFSTKRLAEIFGVDPILIDKYKTKQPERIPSAIEALEKLRLKAGIETKGVSDTERKRIRSDKMDFIAERISNAPLFQDMAAIAGSEMSDDDKKEAILTLGKERGGTLSIIIDPANEPQSSDSKKVQREKREKQYTKATYLLNTFASFTKKTGYKDIVGLGNLVDSLSHKADVEIKDPVERKAFKEYTRDYFNIDLDKKEHFMLPGYVLGEDTPVKGAESKPIVEFSAEEVVAFMWEKSGLPRAEFMADKETMSEIRRVYADLHPGMKKEEMDKKIAEVFQYLVETKTKDIKVGV
jgi:hypothetical protein